MEGLGFEVFSNHKRRFISSSSPSKSAVSSSTSAPAVVASLLPAGVGASVGDCVVGPFGSSVPVVAKNHSISILNY